MLNLFGGRSQPQPCRALIGIGLIYLPKVSGNKSPLSLFILPGLDISITLTEQKAQGENFKKELVEKWMATFSAAS